MTEEQRAAHRMLRALANERGKFAIAVGISLPLSEQTELERLQISGEVRLLDVSPVAARSGVYRVFMFTTPEKPLPRRSKLPIGECAFCDQHRQDPMMPFHDASARCESGKHSHCSCDVCF